MDEVKLLEVIITAIVTGAVSSVATIAGLRVHILYIRERLEDHRKRFEMIENSIARAHTRVDSIEKHLKLDGGH